MKLPQTGGCQCGALRYEITQAPYMVYACHCTDCQRMTSSAFSMAIVLPAEAFRLIAGKPRVGAPALVTVTVNPALGLIFGWVAESRQPGGRIH
jgi:hypothetical protein